MVGGSKNGHNFLSGGENLRSKFVIFLSILLILSFNFILVFASDDYGFALGFDGVDDYVEVSPSASLNFSSGDFSVQVWMKTSLEGMGVVNKWGSDTDIGWFLAVSGTPTTGAMMVYLTDGVDYVQNVTDEIVDDGEWHLLAFTRSNFLKFYIDGELVKQVDVTAIDSIDSDDPLFIGVLDSDDKSDWFDGTIDEVLLYSREINSTEITYSYNNGNGRYTPLNQTSLVAWWHFDEGSGTALLDETANNNDGTLYGDTDEWVAGKILLSLSSFKINFRDASIVVVSFLILGCLLSITLVLKVGDFKILTYTISMVVLVAILMLFLLIFTNWGF